MFATAAGAEIDLLLKRPGERKPWAIEIKRSLAPKLERGFLLACDTVKPLHRRVVYGGSERFPLAISFTQSRAHGATLCMD